MEPEEQQPLPRKGALTRRLRYWLQLCKNVWAQKIFGEEEFKNGRGTYGWSNGNKYEGEWKEDHRHGRGRMIYADGDKYEGIYIFLFLFFYLVLFSFFFFVFVFSFPSNLLFPIAGDWREGKKHGFGIVTYMNGSKYEGTFVGGERDGKVESRAYFFSFLHEGSHISIIHLGRSHFQQQG